MRNHGEKITDNSSMLPPNLKKSPGQQTLKTGIKQAKLQEIGTRKAVKARKCGMNKRPCLKLKRQVH